MYNVFYYIKLKLNEWLQCWKRCYLKQRWLVWIAEGLISLGSEHKIAITLWESIRFKLSKASFVCEVKFNTLFLQCKWINIPACTIFMCSPWYSIRQLFNLFNRYKKRKLKNVSFKKLCFILWLYIWWL